MTTGKAQEQCAIKLITQAQLRELLSEKVFPPAEYRDACWFADVWAEHCRPGMHLRAIYYKLMSVGGVTMAAGVRPHEGRGKPPPDPVRDQECLPFENSKFCWLYLQKAALAARRCLRVDARAFEEHRSPEPDINVVHRDTPTPAVLIPDTWGWPESRECPLPEVTGYDYDSADQPLHVELWCEKSTMDDVLAPLCQALRVNYQPLTGMFSLTRTIEMLCRLNKPTIVLYVSDLDGAGINMPAAFAETLRWFAPFYARDITIHLKQIALTEQQVLDFSLPRNVIDKQDETPYNRQFRAKHPLGPCELDALEAIHPGALAKIVRKAVQPYFDKTINSSLLHAQIEADGLVETAWIAHTADARQDVARIEHELLAIRARRDAELAPHEEAIAEIRARFDVELQPHRSERDDVVARVLSAPFDVDLPARPQPAVTVPNDNWLFVSAP